MRITAITVDPGALDDVPVVELARFLARYDLEIVSRVDGWKIRRRPQGTVTPIRDPSPRGSVGPDFGGRARQYSVPPKRSRLHEAISLTLEDEPDGAA